MSATRQVVSLVPSITETLLAWSVTPLACTRFCEQPQLLAVGGTKNPDIAAIVDLAPDLVLMDEEENRFEDAEALKERGIAVFSTAVRSVGDVQPALAALASAIGADAALADATAVPAERPTLTVRAFVPIWRRPYMTINRATYASSALECLGIENVFAAATDRYPEILLAEAMARDPDVVLAPSEPYAFGAKHERELETVAPVIFVDGQDLFWWGVRTPDALRRLAAQISVAR